MVGVKDSELRLARKARSRASGQDYVAGGNLLALTLRIANGDFIWSIQPRTTKTQIYLFAVDRLAEFHGELTAVPPLRN
jgi:hypothetical protein